MHDFRCTCGHGLELHPGSEECREEDCPCLHFEIGWGFEDEVPA
ncbi:MAG TPA: hypothetical protein VEY12_02785 [Thermoplasmata archaeon]|nr:hypothetical protein [Thermoplasmata archaeon]